MGITPEIQTAGKEADNDPGRPEPLWTPPRDMGGATSTPAVVGVQSRTLTPPDKARELRLRRAEEGLCNGWTVCCRAPGEWNVVTNAGTPGYTVRQTGTVWQCDCPDFARNGLGACKHTLAVELAGATPEKVAGYYSQVGLRRPFKPPQGGFAGP